MKPIPKPLHPDIVAKHKKDFHTCMWQNKIEMIHQYLPAIHAENKDII